MKLVSSLWYYTINVDQTISKITGQISLIRQGNNFGGGCGFH